MTAASFLDRCAGGVVSAAAEPPGAVQTWLSPAQSSRAPGRPTTFIVDDDAAVRDALTALLEQVGLSAETYDSALTFLEHFRPGRAGCLVLDVRMPGMDGLELQQTLSEAGVELPIIFLTGYGDVPMAVRAMQAGAVTFIMKPFREQTLLEAVRQGLARDARTRRKRARRDGLRRRLASLTARERQVLDAVVAGKQNKGIAADLGLSPKTIEYHRSKIMSKMHADSVSQLVRLALEGSVDVA